MLASPQGSRQPQRLTAHQRECDTGSNPLAQRTFVTWGFQDCWTGAWCRLAPVNRRHGKNHPSAASRDAIDASSSFGARSVWNERPRCRTRRSDVRRSPESTSLPTRSFPSAPRRTRAHNPPAGVAGSSERTIQTIGDLQRSLLSTNVVGLGISRHDAPKLHSCIAPQPADTPCRREQPYDPGLLSLALRTSGKVRIAAT
jgi:hypothetical protein